MTYSSVFDQCIAYGKKLLDLYFSDSYFFNYIRDSNDIFLFFIPSCKWYNSICLKMIQRANGIDSLSIKYVILQSVLFRYLK